MVADWMQALLEDDGMVDTFLAHHGRLPFPACGNFDIILVHFPRCFKLDGTLDAPRAVVYLVPMLIVC